jgi:hypothetical protein
MAAFHRTIFKLFYTFPPGGGDEKTLRVDVQGLLAHKSDKELLFRYTMVNTVTVNSIIRMFFGQKDKA